MDLRRREPISKRDPTTRRIDYFGLMVNCAALLEARARGGYIACSADIVREISAKYSWCWFATNARVTNVEDEEEQTHPSSKNELPTLVSRVLFNVSQIYGVGLLCL
ncbi:hypothetical protein DL96DRAFT_1705258 [Flagelloscypha sp. PMI_526]|nr:hypothetical protein DL96DRAFT_1705258 [Flagelloscypha sp. PMI_526]